MEKEDFGRMEKVGLTQMFGKRGQNFNEFESMKNNIRDHGKGQGRLLGKF